MLAFFWVFACQKASVTTAVLSNPKNQRKHDRQNPKQCDSLQFCIHFHSLVQDKKNMKERTRNSVNHCSSASNSCAADFSLLNLPKGKSLGRSKPATNF